MTRTPVKKISNKVTGRLELVERDADVFITNDMRTRPRVYLRGPKISFGRALNNVVVLDSHHISRHHCVMKYDNREWKIKDISLNGIDVNGVSLSKNEFVILKNADVISFVSTSPILKYKFFGEKTNQQVSFRSPSSTLINESEENVSQNVNFTPRRAYRKSYRKAQDTLFSEWSEEAKSNVDDILKRTPKLQTSYIQRSPVIEREKSSLNSTKFQPLVPLIQREYKRKQEEDPVKACKIPKLVHSQDDYVLEEERIINKQNGFSDNPPVNSVQFIKPNQKGSKGNDRKPYTRPTAKLGNPFHRNRFFLPPLLFGKSENEVQLELDNTLHQKSLGKKLHLDKEKDDLLNSTKTVDPNAVNNALTNQERLNEMWLSTISTRLEMLKKEREEKEREEQKKSKCIAQQQQSNENGPRRSHRVTRQPERFGCIKVSECRVLRNPARQSKLGNKKEQRHEALEIPNPSFNAKLQKLNHGMGRTSSPQPETYLWERKDWSQRRRLARLEFSRRSAIITANRIKTYLDGLTA